MKTLGQQIKVARQHRHMSQSELARKVGCKQSALSMYEGGRTTALNASVIGKICDVLGLIPPTQAELAAKPSAETKTRCFCPNSECISNLPMTIGAQTVYFPHHHQMTTDEVHCPWCGEVVERACPECQAPVNEGAFCKQCGTPYIVSEVKPVDPHRMERAERFLSWCR